MKDLAHSGYLHLGCGPHRLPSPWDNFDSEVDIAKPLPFARESARFILAEHVIEHVTFPEGFAFLEECRRVLDYGGTLRLAFPDVTRFEEFGNEAYLEFLRSEGWPASSRGDIARFILTCNGHEAAWTNGLGRLSLEAVGFRHVIACKYGKSPRRPLCGVDGHHYSVPVDVARAETTILEATK